MLLAVAIALPVPFGNIVPVIAVCVIAVGLIERDGFMVLSGFARSVAGLALATSLPLLVER